MDKAELSYRRKMYKFMYGEHMDHVNDLILKAYHDLCCRSSVNKLRRMGVVSKICEDKLKDKLLKLFITCEREFKYHKADLDLTSKKVEGDSSKLVVSGNKKNYVAEFNSIISTLKNMNAKPTVSKDKKNN